MLLKRALYFSLANNQCGVSIFFFFLTICCAYLRLCRNEIWRSGFGFPLPSKTDRLDCILVLEYVQWKADHLQKALLYLLSTYNVKDLQVEYLTTRGRDFLTFISLNKLTPYIYSVWLGFMFSLKATSDYNYTEECDMLWIISFNCKTASTIFCIPTRCKVPIS